MFVRPRPQSKICVFVCAAACCLLGLFVGRRCCPPLRLEVLLAVGVLRLFALRFFLQALWSRRMSAAQEELELQRLTDLMQRDIQKTLSKLKEHSNVTHM